MNPFTRGPSIAIFPKFSPFKVHLESLNFPFWTFPLSHFRMNQKVAFWFFSAVVTLTSSPASASSDEVLEVTTSATFYSPPDKENAVYLASKSDANLTVDSRSELVSTDDLPVGSFMVRTSPLASAASTLMFVSFKNLSIPGE